MKSIIRLFSLILLSAPLASAQHAIELEGSYHVMVACHDTHHVEISQLLVPGKDKFSGTHHALHLTEKQRTQLRVGMQLKIKGQLHAASSRQMTKAELRRRMFDHMAKRVGIPPSCKDMGAIISKLKTGRKGTKAACGHDHGELKLIAAADDHEVVSVTIPAHIEVTELTITEGGAR